ncbi:PIG-L family deacetylase [Labrenzia sp. OB1]|uniref:PIG-L family deacetylase n=1 Tax=Labrenzia sp. OB1 TaxID=1561204 RepID=UPI0018FE69A4|nr:PIG-L family deacetylase [Labrenzia sp. OB1]
MKLESFKSAVIVMAHPDDEVLWASSILSTARKVILCYGEAPNDARTTEGRRTVFDEFPLSTAFNLNIAESHCYDSTHWREPVETSYGVRCGRNKNSYKKNFHLLVKALEAHIKDGDLVVTHNPWGEYGHEEHIQVFRAVAHIGERRNIRIFVSSYVSDRVLYFMERNTPRLAAASDLLPTDKALGEKLMRHYQAHNCWTWEDGYKWPDYECFYEIVNPWAALRSDKLTMSSMPVNVIWLDEQTPTYTNALRSTKKRLISGVRSLLQRTGSKSFPP